MLDGYFGIDYTDEQKQRLLAVQAAVEITLASAGASSANPRHDELHDDLKYAAEGIGPLADAIQAALEVKKV